MQGEGEQKLMAAVIAEAAKDATKPGFRSFLVLSHDGDAFVAALDMPLQQHINLVIELADGEGIQMLAFHKLVVQRMQACRVPSWATSASTSAPSTSRATNTATTSIPEPEVAASSPQSMVPCDSMFPGSTYTLSQVQSVLRVRNPCHLLGA